MQLQPNSFLAATANAAMALSLEDLIDITEQLADLLDEESEYLRLMQIKNIPALSEEKMKLTQMLEFYQRAFEANPDLFKGADEAMKRRFKAINTEFNAIVQENFRLNAVARTVNGRVVQAITDAVFENQRPNTYNKQGTANSATSLTMSLNLNQRA